MLFLVLLGLLIAVVTGLVNNSQRRLLMAAAVALLIVFFGMPISEATGFLSRQTIHPTALGILPLYPLIGLLFLTGLVPLLAYRLQARVLASLGILGGLASLFVLLGWQSHAISIVRQVPLLGLMEAFSGLLIAAVFIGIGWSVKRWRWLLSGIGLALGLLTFFWLNSPTGHRLFPQTEGYYRLLAPAPAEAEAEIIEAFNAGLDDLNRQRRTLGLSQLEPLSSITGLSDQKLPREAADDETGPGYRLMQAKHTGYGTPIIFLLTGLMMGAGGMLLWRKQLSSENDVGSGAMLALVLTLLVPAFAATDFSLTRLLEGWPFLRDFLNRAWPPDPTAIKEVAQQMLITIEIALVGTFLAALFAIPLSFLASRNLTQGNPLMRTVFALTRTFFNVDRGVDTLILALVFVAAVGLGPFAGVLAMAIHSIADLGKVYSESIENMERGPIEALEAVGASGSNVVRWAILPQVAPLFVGWTLYRFEINFRVSIVIGLVGAGGIGFFIQEKMGNGSYDEMVVAIIAIVIVVNIIDFASSWLRSRLV